MTLKFLQLNTFQGKFLPRIVDFVKENDIDICHFQEVTNGSLSRGGTSKYGKEIEFDPGVANPETTGINCFQEFLKRLEYSGELVKTISETVDNTSFLGNAIFFKPSLQLIEERTVILHDYAEIEPDYTDWAHVGRAALLLKFKIDGTVFWSGTTHLAWSPTDGDTDIKLEQSQKLYDSLIELDAPFIFSGDFNANPHTKTASLLENIATNLTKKYHITNTLNPHVHNAKRLFPKGLPVDMMYVTPEWKVKTFQVIEDIDLSDHLGLVAEVEI